jgi:uncharacterized protein YijF (DUF1287 family)
MSQQRTQAARPNELRTQATPAGSQSDMRPVDDLIHYLREYTRERPETVAMVCFAAGFILGWRLKPW